MFNSLKQLFKQLKKSNSLVTSYFPLSPTDEAENIDHYLDSLQWGLQKDKNILNIALSGPFGSGKSSILKTFQKKYKHDFKFLNISLATFKDHDETDSKNTINQQDGDLPRLIEVSILQQLFYHEKDEKIPDSRFKKIKRIPAKFIWFITIGSVFFINSVLFLFFPNILEKITIFSLPINYSALLRQMASGYIISCVMLIIFQSIRTLKSLTISKLKINNTEIEIQNNVNKSILNHHLDEILYFFEVTKYNVVIIEDLDRFKQTDIFTKLRELNFLINQSKKIRNKVIFIYAIKDDMFQNEDRTKFFDFIIPIIPVINFSNSKEKLLEIVKNNNYKITEELIDNISLFIHDLRLLYNIMNEYQIYSNVLNKDLDQDKLLSIIVYKNMYPKDFSELHQSKGSLYQVISQKNAYIKHKVQEIDEHILKHEKHIELLETNKFKNINELRSVYILKVVEKISSRGFQSFYLNQQRLEMSELIEDKNFQAFISQFSSMSFQSSHSGRIRFIDFGLNFEKIEMEIDSTQTYKEREKILTEGSEIEKLKEKIQVLTSQKASIKKVKIQELVNDDHFKMDLNNKNQKEIISILLRYGYIAEDYLDYLTIFYEGSLSKNDYQFLINIRTQKSTDFDFKLDNINNLIKRINIYDFENKYILNFDFLNYLLTAQVNEQARKKVFSLLANESKTSFEFICKFIDITSNTNVFIQQLCKYWGGIWEYIEKNSNFINETKEYYFYLIIENAYVEDIAIIFKNQKTVIEDCSEFLNLIDDLKKIEKIISTLNINFSNIEPSSPPELFKFIQQNNYYQLNPRMLSNLLKFNNVYKKADFNTRNYYAIKTSGIESLIEYVDNNINKYIANVYFKTGSNNNEGGDCLTLLLNNKEIENENIEKIINSTQTLIQYIDKIENIDIIELLLMNQKVLPTWNNIFAIYLKSEESFSDTLISFINRTTIAEKLSKNRILTNGSFADALLFINKIILEERIENEIYDLILKSIPENTLSEIDFENLSKEKVEILIKHNFLEPSSDNFDTLKQYFDKLQILLVERNSQIFSEEIENFNLYDDDIIALLRSNISLDIKEKCIRMNALSDVVSNQELLNEIGILLYKQADLNVEPMLVQSIITDSNLDSIQKVKLFNRYQDIMTHAEVDWLLTSLDKTFPDVEKGESPIIEDSEENNILVQNLIDMEYISSFKKEKNRIIIERKKRI